MTENEGKIHIGKIEFGNRINKNELIKIFSNPLARDKTQLQDDKEINRVAEVLKCVKEIGVPIVGTERQKIRDRHPANKGGKREWWIR